MADLTVEEALARILAGVTPLEAETVDLLAAHGRVLAAPVVATLTQPPFPAAAMDGYAVRAADVATLPAVVDIIGESAAGSGFRGHVGPGEAVRILTGAPVPDGADAIVIQENTSKDGYRLTVVDGRPDPAHIRPRGWDFAEGATLLEPGRRLDARAITLAAAAGHASLTVRRRPRVGILATGSELVPPGTPLGPDQIVCSNSVGLAAQVSSWGAEPVMLGIAPDELDVTVERLEAGAATDVIVTTGGASVGDHDLVRPALLALGATLDFYKLAMRPGKPIMFGRRGHQRLLGLPGNPVSALVGARVFLAPLVAALSGRPGEIVAPEPALLAVAVEANGPRQHYMRGRTVGRQAGLRLVEPIRNQDSSLLAPLAAADVLIVRPPRAPAAEVGETVHTLTIDF